MVMAEKVSIELKNVCKKYGETKALDNVSIKIYGGEFVTIIGSSGCGKTTLLKTVNALVKPDSGSVLVNGKDVAAMDVIKLRRSIGYVIQNIGLFPHMNVKRNISYVPTLINRKSKTRDEEYILRLIKVVGLDESILSRFPSELSGGQQQRVGLARALAAEPNILLMDEPFGSVDEITRKMLQDEIKRIHKTLRCTILFVTHDIDEALRLGDRVVVMNNGSIIQIGTPQFVCQNPADDFVSRLLGRN